MRMPKWKNPIPDMEKAVFAAAEDLCYENQPVVETTEFTGARLFGRVINRFEPEMTEKTVKDTLNKLIEQGYIRCVKPVDDNYLLSVYDLTAAGLQRKDQKV